ncbi:MAG TPA: DUF3455 domain-containing protein [Candidatus Binatia bacterium]|nr:DUF3455 domain-containing protein [Candidatus Binatia bacterium]
MNAQNARTPDVARRRRSMGWAVALVGAWVGILQPPVAHAVMPPPMPMDLEVPATERLFRAGHAVGTQNYVCLPKSDGTGFEWVLYGPTATLFSDHGRQEMTHFLSPNPDESGTPPRATWQDSRDTSAVWAVAVESSTDPMYVAPDAIAWLKLQRVGRDRGPHGGRRLATTTWVQRLNTVGGKAPATGCADASNVGQRKLVPYEADYFFYKSTARD